ncbi:MAG TPA: Crp/Fnr family transcriptional regulator [Acetobacteraceae bacterium]|nr:Crp/Fnr family transcriptional regulator [Acetobacteraceae bacterium]
MTGSDVRELLSRSPLFQGSTEALIDEVLRAVNLRIVPARATLFHQGDPARELIVLGKGIVRAWQMGGSGDALTIRIMGLGDIIGVVPALRQTPYPITATAITDCVLLSWPSSWILGLMERYPTIRANALDFVGRRTEELVNRLRETATERVDQRIARALLRLVDQTGHASAGGGELGYKLSRQDIAEIVGTDLYSVSRILRGWADRGLVSASRLRVAVLDRPGMERIARGDA